jgi:hypothetical protein
MPASEKFTVDLSAVERPAVDPGGNRAARRAKSTPRRGHDDRSSSSTKVSRGKPAAQPKRYAFRRA